MPKAALTKKKKTGYTFGIFTESLIYNMFYTYYLTFLNEIVGIQPKYSSIIIFISIAWDAVTDPMIGNYTDRIGVDKRKVMKGSLIPLAVIFIVAWSSIGAGFTSQTAKIILYTVISMAIVVPLVEATAKKKDRRFAAILFLLITFAGEIAIKIIGLDAEIAGFRFMCILSPVILGIGTGTFWTLFYSMGYALVELDKFKTGERRESTITALPQLIQKFGSAFGILMAGQLLSFYGYDSSKDTAGSEALFTVVTDEKIINGMENISTVIPAIFLLLSIISAILYPMTRKRFNALMVQLKKKRNGEEYTTEGFENCYKNYTFIQKEHENLIRALLIIYAVLRESFSLSAIIAMNSEFVGLPRCD